MQLHAAVISPIAVEVKENMSLDDGEYFVTFNPLQASYTTSGLKVTFYIYETARYEVSQVENIAVGDKVNCYGNTINVNAVEKQDESVAINPDEFEMGNNFYFNKTEDGYYCIATNDCPSYEVVKGTATVVIPNSVHFKDYSEDPDEPVFVPCRRIKATLSPEGPEISNIVITIEGGKLTSIERFYMP